jgi:N-sulfoglucosamine sulfohydrolase
MQSSARPNILLIIPHDLGTFLRCYGNSSVSSPHLDALAQRGVRFTNFFTTCPECTSSRGSLMTGLYPHQNGLMGLAGFGWELRVPHLAGRLRDAGYRTHLFGFQHETQGSPEGLGYQEVHSQDNRRVGPVCASVEAFLRDEAEQARGPWFASCGFFDVHRRWRPLVESRFDPRKVEVPAFLPDLPIVRADLARFHQDIEVMDEAVGSVLAALERTGKDRDTLVIFTTDHGAAFPNAKATLYDAGVRIPLIIHRRGAVEGGRSCEQLVSNTDVVPTLLEMAGIGVPPALAGRSFLPLLEGKSYSERETVGGALFYDVAYDPMHYIRTREHKYIRSYAVTPEDAHGADPEALSCFFGGRHVRVDDFDVLTAPTWQVFPREGGKPPVEELYELRSDPAEQHDLAASTDHREVLDCMRALLRVMMEETGSPLLSGHVAPPEKQKEVGRRHWPGGELYLKEVAERMKLI